MEITKWTHVIFGLVKEGISEILDGRLGAFHIEIVAGQLGAHLELKAFGALESIGKEDPTTSTCRMGSEVVYASCFKGRSIP